MATNTPVTGTTCSGPSLGLLILRVGGGAPGPRGGGPAGCLTPSGVRVRAPRGAAARRWPAPAPPGRLAPRLHNLGARAGGGDPGEVPRVGGLNTRPPRRD